ncbi:hypothetical protein TWF225_000060 [Orbilia oligospora]|uniref:Uncharacterized protein n=1 Tax=Orbilia oligospora TaxID=2813651 RepID=A0A7C8K8L0_ORBOL|nr:hypothetical protein TWF751_008097 [Orbilia oligospora]KAF3195665.1 hypothetical protein TWF225_000060 [Orbilia oligospora]KAF3255019.1 hypothetical protein TWF217_006721 [Orbilia oligospora]KAF3256032.1 hypothetical protein TWF128_005472 [Orbilia oligospora]KAF3294206.1 hypothetical protein TWF132_003638 [Orbilia oligospora]
MISEIPLELLREILQYLSLKDIKSFSTCSKQCRFRSLQNVFRAIAICQESARALRDRGSLCSLVTTIRYAILRPSNSSREVSQEQFHDLVKECRVSFDILKHFKNLEVIEIADFKLPEQFEYRLLSSTFKKLSTYPLFKNLKRIQMLSASARSDFSLAAQYKHYLDNLTDENNIFIENGVLKQDEIANFPKGTFNLEELSLNVRDIYVDDSEHEESIGFADELLISSRLVLKRLSINAYHILFSEKKNCIFPALSFLSIWCGGVGIEDMSEISCLFPNIEELRIGGERYRVYERVVMRHTEKTPYVEIGCMPKLKRVFLPQPSDLQLKFLNEGELDKTVEYWMGKRPDQEFKLLNPSPLTMLEQVEFCNGSTGALECCIIDGDTRRWRTTRSFSTRMQEDPTLRPVGWDFEVGAVEKH